jgi:hypothetical protein
MSEVVSLITRFSRRFVGRSATPQEGWLDRLPTAGVETIYVKSDLPPPEIARQIAVRIGGQLRGWTVSVRGLEIDVVANDDREQGKIDPADAFLFYPYLLEVDWLDPGASTAQKVDDVASIQGALDSLGTEYVAATDFDAELPNARRSPPR